MATGKADLIIDGQAELDELVSAFEGLSGRLKKMQGRLKKIEKTSTRTSKIVGTGFTRLTRTMETGFRRILTAAVTTFGVAGVGGLFKQAIGAAQSFEFELRKVGTLLRGEASKDLNKYRGAIIKLSKDTGQSVEVLSAGLFDVISASVKGTDSVKGAMKLLTVSTKAAVGGFTDASTAVDVMTTVLNSYGLTTENATEVSDKLLTVARLGKTTFGEMAPELGKVAKVASSAGVTLDELGGAIVELTKNGRQINFAMTDVRAIITALLKPTEDLQALFTANGFASGEAALKARGFAGVMELIGQKTGGSTEQLLRYIPQQEAIAGASILAAKDVGALSVAIDEVGNAAGATDEAYEKMASTFDQKAARFKAQLNELFIRLGNEILPVVIEKMEEIAEWVDGNSNEIVTFLKDAANAIISFGEFIISNGKTIATTLAGIWAAGKVWEFSKALSSVSKALTGVSVAGGPIFMTVAAIGALINAIRVLVNSWDDLKDAIGYEAIEKPRQAVEDELFKTLKDLPVELQERFLSKLEDLGGGAQGLLGFGGEHVTGMAENLRKRIKLQSAALDEYGKDLSTKLDAVYEGVNKKQWEEAITAAEDVADTKADVEDEVIRHLSEKEKEELEKQFVKRLRILEKLDKEFDKANAKKAAAEKKRFEDENKRLKEKYELEKEYQDSINKSFEKATKKYHEIRAAAAERAFRIEEAARQRALDNINEWKQRITDVFTGIGQTVVSELDSMFGGIYRKAWQQVRELISKGIEAAAEGEKQLVLTEADRSRIEQEMGRPLTDAEAKARATAYTNAQLSELQSQGRIGDYQVVGTETPADRMSEILATMQEWWTNLADNLGPILDWLMDEAVPQLIEKIAASAPRIIQALNESWVQTLPKIVDLIAKYLEDVFDQVPSIVTALIDGIMGLVERLAQRLPEIMQAIFSSMTDMTTTLVGVLIKLLVDQVPSIAAEITKALPRIVFVLLKELVTKLLPETARAIVNAIKDIGGPSKSKGGNAALALATGGLSALFHSGGMIESGRQLHRALKAHQGMFVSPSMAADEVPIIAQTGEAVLSREGVAAVGGRDGVDRINRGGSSVVNNVNISTEYLVPGAAAEAIDAIQAELLRAGRGSVNKALNQGKVVGLATKV